jgi:YfiH family protein
MMITTSALLNEQNHIIRHGFFTREGGVSEGPFASLNVGFASGDDPDRVTTNRNVALEFLGLRNYAMVNCYQMHSASAFVVREATSGLDPRGDGLVTDTKGLALSIFTADCAPVLLLDPEKKIIAAAHVGWKGGISGIVDNTIKAMVDLGARPQKILAAIGPCIQTTSYEVGSDVYNMYINSEAANERFFKEKIPGQKWFMDVPAYIENRLMQCSVESITKSLADTYTDKQHYFSARRSMHAGERQYGRMLSAIALV